MRRVMQRVEEHALGFERHGLFALLRDQTIDPRRRCSFFPSAAHFIMTFADICRLVLYEAPARDRVQEIVNMHTSEDATHWRWYVADLRRLGQDQTLTFGEALERIWSDETTRTRALSYHLCRLSLGAEPLQKLAVVLVLEASFGAAIGHVASVASEVSRLNGETFEFIGDSHLEAEDGHSLWTGPTRQWLDEIRLEERRLRELTGVVDEAAAHFRAFFDELYAIARRGIERAHST